MSVRAWAKALPGASGLLGINSNGTGARCNYRGFTIKETTGAATAFVRIREGGVGGDILDTIPLAAGEGVSAFYEAGINCDGDLYVQIVSGAVEGSVRYS